MRYAVFSDVHASIEALEAVLANAARHSPDAYLCLGDVVGYGPDPNACVDRVRRLGSATVAGNHDRGAVGRLDPAAFSPLARAAIEWTARELTAENRAFLAALPDRFESPAFVAVHGSPREPVEEYVLDLPTALAVFAETDFRVCLVGHTHLPIVFVRGKDGHIKAQDLRPDGVVRLSGASRYIVNAGSVGQPRDGDPRAAYLIFDDEAAAVTLHRVDYPIAATQAKMAARGLPPLLSRRLAAGT
ncbi:MAG TPA: metallophosphoesterase family protein [bacterium]|nr:metallophosphoesterase family protein [bacterium]